MSPIAFTMLHGFLGVPDFWIPVQQRLMKVFSDAIFHLPLLPGHGPGTETASIDESPSPFPATFPATFNDVIDRYVQQIPHISPLFGVGYSMGARLLLGAALAYPSRFNGLVLISGHPGIQKPSERGDRAQWERQLIQMMNREGMASLVSYFEALPVFQTQKHLPATIRQRQRQQRLAHHPEAIAAALPILGLGHTPPMTEPLRHLNLPILFITGEADKKYTDIAEVLSPRCRLARHVIVREAGHNTILEKPDETAESIASFVKNQLS